MKRKELITRLIASLEAFILHSSLIEELMGELKHTGRESEFLKILLTRLKYLQEQGPLAIHHKEFERLNDRIYSLHVTGTSFNIRILYGFLPEKRPVLLLAFFERAGHRNTDYQKHIPAAESRLKEMEEELS